MNAAGERPDEGEPRGSSSYLVQLACQLDLGQVLPGVAVVRDQPFQSRLRRPVAARPHLGEVGGGQGSDVFFKFAIGAIAQGKHLAPPRFRPQPPPPAPPPPNPPP